MVAFVNQSCPYWTGDDSTALYPLGVIWMGKVMLVLVEGRFI